MSFNAGYIKCISRPRTGKYKALACFRNDPYYGVGGITVSRYKDDDGVFPIEVGLVSLKNLYRPLLGLKDRKSCFWEDADREPETKPLVDRGYNSFFYATDSVLLTKIYRE